jgi:glycosyltransferase involved in cell wall biosynthesis
MLVANTSWFLLNFELPLIRELKNAKIHVLAVAPRDDASAKFESIGVPFREAAMDRRGLNPVHDIAFLRQLYTIYREEKPDIVFHNTVKPVIYGSIAASYAGVPSVLNMIPGLGYVFVDGGRKQRWLRALVRTMYRVSLRSSRKVFFQNPDDQDYFVRHRLVRRDQAQLTYGLGVDLEKFYFVEPQSRGGGGCTFMLMSRLLWDKGVGEFVTAAAHVKGKFPTAKFILLGRIDAGNPSGISKSVVDEWCRSGTIEYLGEVADIRQILEKVDVVVLPSYYREGIPNSLMEAMSMGKSIITTDSPGCRETVVNDYNGLLIPPRDVDSLVSAMEFMISNTSRRLEMGRNGRSLAEQRFDVRRVNALILQAMNLDQTD